MVPALATDKAKTYTLAIVNSYAETLFLQGPLIGVVILACTLVHPNVGLAGLVCVLCAYLFAHLIGTSRDFLQTGIYTFNALLVGLSAGYLFEINLLTLFLLATAGILTLVVTMALSNIFQRFFLLPVLSIPFVLVSSLCYLASRTYSNLFVTSLYPQHHWLPALENTPTWLAGLTRSLGALFFVPDVAVGFVLLAALLFVSRILFFLSIVGYALGTGIVALMTGSAEQAFSDLYAFNFILIAVAIGGVFLIPGPRSYVMALCAVAVSPFLLEAAKTFWAQFGLPVFTMPFNIVTLSFVYVLGLVRFPTLTAHFRGTPERNLDHFLTYQARFHGSIRALALPFAGEWTVWQGPAGRWTHKGRLAEAFDFVITGESGGTHRDDGSHLDDYLCYRKPILAPVSGRVIRTAGEVLDNEPGHVDRERKWGNFVLLQDPRGFTIMMAHLAQGSLKAAEGDWIAQGRPLGLCGSSGYSPQPHLHIQVQATPELEVQSLPFSFLHYEQRDGRSRRYRANHRPEEGDRVTPLYPDKALEGRMTLLLDDMLTYQVNTNGRRTEESFIVRMAPSGSLYLDGGRSRLYFDKREGTFTHLELAGPPNPALRALFLALPRLPLCGGETLAWEDILPLETLLGRWTKGIALFACSFRPGLVSVEGRYALTSPGLVEGEIRCRRLGRSYATTATLSEEGGAANVHISGRDLSITLERVTR